MTIEGLFQTDPVYQFSVVSPSASAPDGDALGIEVTIRDLAAQCSLGNIDPQHGPGGRLRPAAIEVALRWPLPPLGAALITIRPDLDSFGAMAVLWARSKRLNLTDRAVRHRIREIARADGGPAGPWPGPRLIGRRSSVRDGSDRARLGAIVDDRTVPVEARVGAVAEWLFAGNAPERIVEYDPGADDAQVTLGRSGRVAIVRSAKRDAMRVGYSCAPVVIAENLNFRTPDGKTIRKVTIGQWGAGYADLERINASLSRYENGWGGTATVIGSPQFDGTALDLGLITGIVEDNMEALWHDS